MIDLRIVLVSPKYPRNIGMVSRIMCNYDLSRLILVKPQCEIDEQAKQGAAQGQEPLTNASIYSSWPAFNQCEQEGLRIAFSRRRGKRRTSEPLLELLHDSSLDVNRPVYLFFGAEDHGLSGEDLDLCHRLVYFDLPGSLKSMNLSHATLVAIQAFRNHFHDQTPTANSSIEAVGIHDPGPILKSWLEALDFDLESQKKWNALVMLKQLILRASPTPKELHQLEMIVQQTIRRLKGQ